MAATVSATFLACIARDQSLVHLSSSFGHSVLKMSSQFLNLLILFFILRAHSLEPQGGPLSHTKSFRIDEHGESEPSILCLSHNSICSFETKGFHD
ncbi:hypothetical protein TNCV_2584801 [Trichonephila clavipes]|nr:hypothetical protein TNCV_2584801 [Trichonephila clavipes]